MRSYPPFALHQEDKITNEITEIENRMLLNWLSGFEEKAVQY